RRTVLSGHMYFLLCGASILHHTGGLHKLWDVLNCIHNAHMFYIKVRDIEERTALIVYLKEHGVQAVFHYIPLHSAPAGIQYGRFHGEDRFTTQESNRLLRLPMYYGITNKEIETVTTCIKSFFQQEKQQEI
ncbi:MAG: hypothetical protein HFG17_12105, partial [Oscillospiraceae bacterium]|nr:hypothetical protein [Oscillospiraceae bacterium]